MAISSLRYIERLATAQVQRLAISKGSGRHIIERLYDTANGFTRNTPLDTSETGGSASYINRHTVRCRLIPQL